jgi:hypothetical protein
MDSLSRDNLTKALTPFLKELVVSLLEHQPDDPLLYMIKWIEQKLGIKNSKSEKEELYSLRQEIAAIKQHKHSQDEGSDMEQV